MDSSTKQVLDDLAEKMGQATACLCAAVAAALIKRGAVTADEILENYRPPALSGMHASAEAEFRRLLGQAQEEFDKIKS